MSNRQWTWIILALAAALGGCSGGSGDGGSSEQASASMRWPGQATGKVEITTVDAFGKPLAGARVNVSRNYYGGVPQSVDLTTDANGRAAAVFPAGGLSVSASSYDLTGFTTATLEKNQSLSLKLALHPADFYTRASAVGGVARAEVAPGGVSADGTIVEFTLQVIGNGAVPDDLRDAVTLRPCAPDGANDSPVFVADCVAGPAGFDAAYAGAESDKPLKAEYRPAPMTRPTSGSAVLLIGQDDQTVLADPGDQRLLAARYFLDDASAGAKPVLLAAFAANDPASGRPSLLPQQPVTLFPVDNPQFTTDGRSYFGTLDTLATMEGGASPLLAAIAQMIDFNANAAGAQKPSLVVVSGPGNDCGAAAQCRAQVMELAERSRATGVPVVTVGVDPQGLGDSEVLGLLARGAAGSAAFWLEDPKHLPGIFRTLPEWLREQGPSLDLTFRIRSPMPGAFASGRVVKGEAVVSVCPWDCYAVSVPFVLRIP